MELPQQYWDVNVIHMVKTKNVAERFYSSEWDRSYTRALLVSRGSLYKMQKTITQKPFMLNFDSPASHCVVNIWSIMSFCCMYTAGNRSSFLAHGSNLTWFILFSTYVMKTGVIISLIYSVHCGYQLDLEQLISKELI